MRGGRGGSCDCAQDDGPGCPASPEAMTLSSCAQSQDPRPPTRRPAYRPADAEAAPAAFACGSVHSQRLRAPSTMFGYAAWPRLPL